MTVNDFLQTTKDAIEHNCFKKDIGRNQEELMDNLDNDERDDI